MTGPGLPLPIVRSSTVDDRHGLARRAGQERFVGAVQVLVAQHRFAHVDADVAARSRRGTRA